MRVGADVWLSGLSVAMVSSMMMQRHWPWPVYLCYLISVGLSFLFVYEILADDYIYDDDFSIRDPVSGDEIDQDVKFYFYGPYAGDERDARHIVLYTVLAVVAGMLPDLASMAFSLMNNKDSGCCSGSMMAPGSRCNILVTASGSLQNCSIKQL